MMGDGRYALRGLAERISRQIYPSSVDIGRGIHFRRLSRQKWSLAAVKITLWV